MLLRWSQQDLAKASGISLPTIKRLESQAGPIEAYRTTKDAIEAAFRKAGVEFTFERGGLGVRLRKTQI